MGDRGHITIEQYGDNPPVVLYTHWHAHAIPGILANALKHEKRWGDPEYLTRIIFDELSDTASEFTGCGIGTAVHGDAWRNVIVDTDEGEIRFDDLDGWNVDERAGETYEFREFVIEEQGEQAFDDDSDAVQAE